MSPALIGSTVLQRFKCGNTVEIRNGIMFDFYPWLPHMRPSTIYHAIRVLWLVTTTNNGAIVHTAASISHCSHTLCTCIRSTGKSCDTALQTLQCSQNTWQKNCWFLHLTVTILCASSSLFQECRCTIIVVLATGRNLSLFGLTLRGSELLAVVYKHWLLQCQSSSGSVGESIWLEFRFESWLDLNVLFYSLSIANKTPFHWLTTCSKHACALLSDD